MADKVAEKVIELGGIRSYYNVPRTKQFIAQKKRI